MKHTTLISFSLAFIIASATSCQSNGVKAEHNANKAPDTIGVRQPKPAETGYAAVNGLKMYYETYGNGKPLVLLHGSFLTIPLNWSHIIPLLAKDRKVIVAEMQGHGRTRDIAREMSYENMADDVSGLLKHLKIDSADILGYSMGGGIAFQLAVRHPEQVRRLIVVSAPSRHDGWLPEVEASLSKANAEQFKGSPIQKQYDSLGNDPAHFAVFVKKVVSSDLKPYNWTTEVNKIKAPLFLVIGDADGIRYEHALELFRARGGGKMGDLHGMPKSRLAILPGTSHVGMVMQRADWLIPMVNDFLNANLNEAPPTFEK